MDGQARGGQGCNRVIGVGPREVVWAVIEGLYGKSAENDDIDIENSCFREVKVD
jgi:hypothetical protein